MSRYLSGSPLLAATALAGALMAPAGAAAADPVGSPTVVTHGNTHTVTWDGDICGARANTTTYHSRIEQVQFFERPDGTFLYRDVAVVTYESDYVDPTLPDLSGRLTEVNHFVLTRGEVFVGVTTYHDFFGDIRIYYRLHITERDGEPVVIREIEKVTGCP